MKNRSSTDVRKRIAARKRNKERERGMKRKSEKTVWPVMAEEKEEGMESIITYEANIHQDPPFIKKEWIIFRVLASMCLVLIMAIVYRTTSPVAEQARAMITPYIEQEFQFATVAAWFEEKFDQPLAFLPENTLKDKDSTEGVFAMPAIGKIMESFEKNGQGVMVKTSDSTSVETIEQGVVIYAGEKDAHGKTIIIQHPDKSESWYGNLQEINVNLYEQVEKKKKIGLVSPSDEPGKGEFYFALKSNGKFIDPKEVVPFE